ncbi:hypothetical protein B5P43_21445 [Bacillus sp. SRB_336]|nr:hypothetical protein B5P43_21445 [Bacillus sp. SRB_336]
MASVHASPAASSKPSDAQHAAAIHTEDVYRFYKIYAAHDGHPTPEQLQHDYLDPGSKGLHRLAELRNVTGATIAGNIAKHPAVYSDARRCMAVLPGVRQRLGTSLGKLRHIYPSAVSAPLTIAVGRGKPVGVTDASGVMIGLEALCGINYFESNVEDRFVHVLAHEYVHVQQAAKSPAFYDKKKPTVLETSLLEGAAEFVGELISGSVANVELPTRTRGHEKAIETAFIADEDKTDFSEWLYNGTLTKPGDLGYWVGYRIVKSYYLHAHDKPQALRDILEMSDAKAFLARSGWHPGIRMTGPDKSNR